MNRLAVTLSFMIQARKVTSHLKLAIRAKRPGVLIHRALAEPGASLGRLFWATTVLALLFGQVLMVSVVPADAASLHSGPAASVDPMIGTGKGPGGNINLFPGPTMPFSMVRLSPDTESHGYGYHHYQPEIQGFSMDHGSGPGCANEGDVYFTATTGPVETATSQFESTYSHSQEAAPPTGFIEGSGWHYQWLEPSDLAWTIHAIGRTLFNQRLESFFSYKTPGRYGQHYNPYNETDLEAPFEFDFSGMPWESQRVVRRVLKENYTTAPDGIPGNHDCGEMSSWAVLSMIGIYTVDPASLAYELDSPVFCRVVIHLSSPYTGKIFTIKASPNPEARPYVQSVKLNGKDYGKNWIKFGDISAGGALQFVLGPRPNKRWGAAASDAPPSLSATHPS